MAGLFAIVGYFCGLLEGSENQLILAACFGAVGGLVSLLGYGSHCAHYRWPRRFDPVVRQEKGMTDAAS